MGITTIATGTTIVATGVENSYVAMGIDDIINACHYYSSIYVHPSPQTLTLSFPHTRWCPLLLHVYPPPRALLRVLRVSLHTSTSLLHVVALLLLHDANASFILHPSIVETTFLLRLLLCCWVHVSLASSTRSSSANPLPLSFPLPL
jgi:hypothetical protein